MEGLRTKMRNPFQNERVEKEVHTKIIVGLILHFVLCSLFCCFTWAEGGWQRDTFFICSLNLYAPCIL